MKGVISMKKIGRLFLVLILTAACLMPACLAMAAESLDIGIDRYSAQNGQLSIYLNHNQGSGFSLSPGDVKVMFGAQEMKTDSIKKFSDTGESISYRCMVDVSGSMSAERVKEAGDMIKALAASKRPKDSIAVDSLGNNLNKSALMTDVSEINAAADALARTREDTNLYYGLVEEIKALQTDDKVGKKRCLIIFSDGAEDQATGITREEAEKMAEESHIPIFTVALLKKGFRTADEESAKILGSFARLSAGGVHYAPALGEGSNDTIPGLISGILNDSFVLYEDLNDIEVTGKEIVLKVDASASNGQTASDSIKLPEGDVKLIQKEIEKLQPEPEPVIETKTEVETPPAENLIFGLPARTFYIIVAGVLGGLLLLLVVIILIIKSRSGAQPMEQYEQYPPQEGYDNPIQPMGYADEGSVTMGVAPGNYTDIPLDEGKTVGPAGISAPAGPGKKATLTRMGKGETGSYPVVLSGNFSIGRSASKSKLSFPDDHALSGLHCSIYTKDGRVYIKDEGSTNGTFVNGVPITGQYELSSDDTILVGSYEYRISWD